MCITNPFCDCDVSVDMTEWDRQAEQPRDTDEHLVPASRHERVRYYMSRELERLDREAEQQRAIDQARRWVLGQLEEWQRFPSVERLIAFATVRYEQQFGRPLTPREHTLMLSACALVWKGWVWADRIMPKIRGAA